MTDRQTKTPRERAEEALGVAERAVERLTEKKRGLQGRINQVTHEYERAVARRDYLAANPDLPAQPRPETGDTP